MAGEVITKSELARRNGISKPRITQLILRGLPVREDGKIDAAAAGKWLTDHRKAVKPLAPEGKPLTLDEAVETDSLYSFLTNLMNGSYATQAEADRVKANALAGLRALELLRRTGAVVEMEVAERALFEVSRAVRDSWLNWPSRIGPMMAADLGLPPDKVVEALTRHVHEQLTEIGEPQADFLEGGNS